MLPPPIVRRTCSGKTFFEVQDFECCALPGVCGNKARKLMSLCKEPKLISPVVSHGGPQSNAMLALASLCAHRGLRFRYHTKPLPRWLRANPTGNLASSLKLGMELVEHPSATEYHSACSAARSQSHTFVPQGGAFALAEEGVRELAKDISQWAAQQLGPDPRGTHVVLPAGTGTTALFLARHVAPGIAVHAVPCVGGSSYLKKQMQVLDASSGAHGRLPEVLEPPESCRTPFGALSPGILAAWEDARACGVLLDLLYGPVAWAAMQEGVLRWSKHSDLSPTPRENAVPPTRPSSWSMPSAVLYINCGGHEGISSQLARYRRQTAVYGAVDRHLKHDMRAGDTTSPHK